jgi:hypothetical protein
LISFRISAFSVLRLEHCNFLGRMPRRWTTWWQIKMY